MAARKPGAKPKPTVSQTEVTFAYRLLQYLHANANNYALLLAIVAWLRSESGHNYIGNNPLNLRPGQDDAPYRSGVRQAGKNGYFSVYASIDAGARATANRLSHLTYYVGIMAAIRRGTSSDLDKQVQATDFMWALILSKWDAGHYGLKGDQLKDPKALYTTTLYKVFYGLYGADIKVPADPAPPKETPPPAPNQPRTLLHVVPKRIYLDGQAARQFYEARNDPIPPLGGM
jgi:hypothetical protein